MKETAKKRKDWRDLWTGEAIIEISNAKTFSVDDVIVVIGKVGEEDFFMGRVRPSITLGQLLAEMQSNLIGRTIHIDQQKINRRKK